MAPNCGATHLEPWRTRERSRGFERTRRRNPAGGMELGFHGGALSALKRTETRLSLARGSTVAVAVAVREEEGKSVCPRWKGGKTTTSVPVRWSSTKVR